MPIGVQEIRKLKTTELPALNSFQLLQLGQLLDKSLFLLGVDEGENPDGIAQIIQELELNISIKGESGALPTEVPSELLKLANKFYNDNQTHPPKADVWGKTLFLLLAARHQLNEPEIPQIDESASPRLTDFQLLWLGKKLDSLLGLLDVNYSESLKTVPAKLKYLIKTSQWQDSTEELAQMFPLQFFVTANEQHDKNGGNILASGKQISLLNLLQIALSSIEG